jgi:cation diffusion facilitator family transporter
MARPATGIVDSVTETSVRRVTLQGAAANLALTVLKGVVGLLSGSLALLADAAHSVSDLATDGVVLAGIWFGTRPPDEDHPYGHGRFETFATFVVALVLMGVGGRIAWEAGYSIYAHDVFYASPYVMAVAIVSVLVKEWMFKMTRRVARATSTPALMANAWHHRSDALSSIAVVLGAIAGLLGWEHGDQVAGLVVGVMVAGVGANIAVSCLREFSEKGLTPDELARFTNVMDEDPDVREWHQLRSRRAGRQVFLDVHVLVDPSLTVDEAHDISDRVELAVKRTAKMPVSITTHIEPYVDQHKEK